ncbi:MAG: tetratricopeptide repeat protein [Prevotellaceae bacterium]|jgi:tetratricopeptide (TPR) repeat protein|nr:tetratricopeptide repeat protein [Prevotellaceae bacterium]
MEKAISLSQIGLYNPQRQSAEVTEKLFVVRRKQFNLLLDRLMKENAGSIPQHYLIIGQRGMGKTTMLKRMETELHKTQYRQQFIPLLFPEEQYNVKNLSEFWLNCLDALADCLELEKSTGEETVAQIDKNIKNLQSLKETEKISEESYKYLMSTCQKLHRRPVLLVDNIGLVFNRLSRHEQHVLRALLSENGAPVIISAGVTLTDDTVNYDAPFYDFFQLHYLKKLSFEEFLELLKNLADVTHSDEKVFSSLQKDIPRQKTLHQLTGGNPRTAVMLFKLTVKGFADDINDDLEALLDEITPLYKARFEELPTQQQIILDAIALNWDAISLKQLSENTGFGNGQISPQLKRLSEDGWIETTEAYQAKGNAYFISERFFNVWFLMRRSSRRQKEKVYCLSRFLECFYGKEGIEKISNDFSKQDFCTPNQILIGLAMSEMKMLKPLVRKNIKEKTYMALFELAKGDEKIIDEFGVSKENILSQLVQKGIALFASQEYDKAIEMFNKAIKLKSDYTEAAYFILGYIYGIKGEYDKAIEAFKKIIQIDPQYLSPKFELISLYRDGLGKLKEATELFDSIDENEVVKNENKNVAVCYYLNKTLFELHKHNESTATESLSRAFESKQEIQSIANDDEWRKFDAAVIKLDYGSWLLNILEEKGYDIVLSPYYTAIQALEIEKQKNKNEAETYLKNRAIEISEPARTIVEKIKHCSMKHFRNCNDN